MFWALSIEYDLIDCDGGWITFDDAGRLMKSHILDDAAAQLLGIMCEMKLVCMAEEHLAYLEYHQRNIFQLVER